MRSWRGRLAALDVAAWLIAVPLVAAGILGSIIAFSGPDRLLPGGEDGTLRLAAPPREVPVARHVSAPATLRLRHPTVLARASGDRRDASPSAAAGPRRRPALVQPSPRPADDSVPGGRVPAPAVEAPSSEASHAAPARVSQGESARVQPRAVRPPAVNSPKVELPKVELPKVPLPKVELPRLEPPNVRLPTVELPTVDVAPVELPRVNVRPVELRSVELAKVNVPHAEPQLSIPSLR